MKNEFEKEFENFDELKFFTKKFNGFNFFELAQNFLNNKELEKIDECATFLKYKIYEFKGQKIKKLSYANFCKNRFCQICNWRRSLKNRTIIKKIFNSMLIEYKLKLRFIFVTFTIKNCSITSLKENINKMNKAFTKMIKFKRFKNSILGYIKVLEVPPQKDNKNYFNPHFHCIFAVSTSYFNSSLNLYLNTQDFRELWQKVLDVDYLPVVNVKIIKKNKKKNLNEINSAIFEIAKYQLKYTDLNDVSIDVFEKYYYSLKNVRNISFGGILKKYKQNIKYDEDDLIYIDETSQVKGNFLGEISYKLKNGKYIII